MKKKISIIGGDSRIVDLANILERDGFDVATFGLDMAEELNENVKKCANIDECVNFSMFILGAIPFSKDGINVYTNFSDSKILISDLEEKLQGKFFYARKNTRNFQKK